MGFLAGGCNTLLLRPYGLEATRFLLEDLVGLAWLRLREGQATEAAAWAAMVRQHPTCNTYVEQRLDELQPALETALNPAELEAAPERGAALDFDAVVNRLLEGYNRDKQN